MSENTITIHDQNFDQEVTASREPFLLDFWSEGCPPCRMIAPVLDELAAEYKGRAKIGKVDAAENPELSTKFRISAVPAIFMVKNGEVIEQVVGARSKKDFKAMIDRAIA